MGTTNEEMRLTNEEIELLRKYREYRESRTKLTEEEIEWIRGHRKRIKLLSLGLIGVFLSVFVGAISYFEIQYLHGCSLLEMSILESLISIGLIAIGYGLAMTNKRCE